MELKYNKSTDTEHKIKLDSELVSATWRQGSAPAGGEVEFQVVTAFVGNGATIKVKGKSEGGANLGKVDGKIRSNKFVGRLTVPEDIEIDDPVYFEVKLSQVGLSGESNRIPAAPPVDVTNMKWSAEEARRGDILKLTADVSGCRDGTEAMIIIYEYDLDNIHDKIVEIPANVKNDKLEIDWEYEYHEDTDDIATDEELQKYGKSYNPPEYFFVVEIAGQKFGREQESSLLNFKDFIEFELLDEDGEAMVDAKYILTLPDGTERRGSVDENGQGREDDVPPGNVRLELDESSDDEDSDSSSSGGGGGGGGGGESPEEEEQIQM